MVIVIDHILGVFIMAPANPATGCSKHEVEDQYNAAKRKSLNWGLNGEAKVTQIGKLNGTALQLELVSGEGFEPVLECVLQRPSKDRFHRCNPCF